MRAPRATGVLELLEDERRGALGDDEAVAARRRTAGSRRRGRRCGSTARASPRTRRRWPRTPDASQPPASMTSASPRRIISAASPMAWPEDAQALVVEKFGPSAPNVMAATPAAMFAIAIGMKNGLRRSGPRVAHVPIWSMSVPVPPRPDADHDAGVLGQLALEARRQAGVGQGLRGGDEGQLRACGRCGGSPCGRARSRGRSRGPRRPSGW